MRPAGKHDVGGTHPAIGRIDALSNARRVDRQCGRPFEQSRTRRFGRRRKTERIIERMDMEGVRQMGRLEIDRCSQHVAHLLGRPHVGVGREFNAEHCDMTQHGVFVVDPRHGEPALDRLDPRHGGIANGITHIGDAAGGKLPELLGAP